MISVAGDNFPGEYNPIQTIYRLFITVPNEYTELKFPMRKNYIVIYGQCHSRKSRNIRGDPGETVLSQAQRALANLICREFVKENE